MCRFASYARYARSVDWLGLATLLLIGLLIVWVVVAVRIGWVLTHPPRRTFAFALAKGWPSSPAELPGELGRPRPFTEWSVRSRVRASEGRELPVWDIRCDGGPGAPVIIFTHGWGESRLHGLLRMGAWVRVASRVILWDMPGHGEAPSASTCRLGTSEHEGLLELISRVHEGEPAAPVILHGFSLGAGVSIVAAAVARERLPGVVRGVIAEAPYSVPQTPARAVLHHNGLTLPLARAAAQGVLGLLWGHGAWWFTRDRAPRFDRRVWAARLGAPGIVGGTNAPPVPLLVLHGERDEICPLDDGRAIAAADRAAERLVIVPGAGHLDLWAQPEARAACEGAVSGFVAGCGRA